MASKGLVKAFFWGLIALVPTASASGSPQDEAINAVYSVLADGKLAAAPAQIASAFLPDAILLDARPRPATTGRQLEASLAPMAARMKSEGVRARTSYRIEQRAWLGDTVVDAGYMRTLFDAGEGAPKPRDMYNRFLVTMKRQPDGTWKIAGDASMPSSKEAWDAAAPSGSLKFDR